MATNIDSQTAMFSLLGANLKGKVKALVIGGSAMLYFGAKDITKDIDLVFLSDRDRNEVLRVLKELGFEERNAKFLYHNKRDVPLLLQRGDDRFDLFNRKIISFRMTDSMAERVKYIFEHGNLIIHVTSPEDIILLKCATGRAGDRKDAFDIISRFTIDWGAIIKESINQMRVHGDIFPMELCNFMHELKEDFGADIPEETIKELEKVALDELEKRLKKGNLIKVTKFRRPA